VAVAEGRSVTQALREARSRRVYCCALAKVYRTRNPHNANARRKRLGAGDPVLGGGPPPPPPPPSANPEGGGFRFSPPPPPRYARPMAAACLLGCLTSPRLLASGHHSASPVYPSCMHLPGAGVPTQGTSHWGHPLGESNAPPGPMPVACLVADEDSLPLSWQPTCLQMYICMYVHLLVVSVVV
jgi:hypothetical protein